MQASVKNVLQERKVFAYIYDYLIRTLNVEQELNIMS